MATIVYGPGYMKTSQGILKLCEVVSCFIGFLLVIIDGYAGAILNSFIIATIIGTVFSLIILVLHVSKTAAHVEGLLSYQIYFNFFWFIFLLVVCSIILSRDYTKTITTSGILGVISCVLYLIDAFDCYRIDPAPVFCINN